MAEPLEFWTFVLTNFMMFGFGFLLTGLSYFAYRRDTSRVALRNATIGFGLLTIGGLIAPIYQIGYKTQYQLDGRELLAVQSVEGLFLAAGLGMLFYSIYRYSNGRQYNNIDTFETVEEIKDH